MIRNYDVKYCMDEYNVNRTRNKKNVERWQYNCGGYALETFNWFCPYGTEEEGEELVDCCEWEDEEYDFNERAEKLVDWMLENVPDLRRVDGPDAHTNSDEVLLGFKTGWGCGDGDFHYIKRSPRGLWFHKPGGSYARRMSKREALSQTWCDGRYESDTIWMVRKIKK